MPNPKRFKIPTGLHNVLKSRGNKNLSDEVRSALRKYKSKVCPRCEGSGVMGGLSIETTIPPGSTRTTQFETALTLVLDDELEEWIQTMPNKSEVLRLALARHLMGECRRCNGTGKDTKSYK